MPDMTMVHQEKYEGPHGIGWEMTVYRNPKIKEGASGSDGRDYLTVAVTFTVPFEADHPGYARHWTALTDGAYEWDDRSLSALAEKTRSHANRIVEALVAAFELGTQKRHVAA